MLMIRLQRTGRKNDASFRILVTEKARSAKTGNVVEFVGSYYPKTKDIQLKKDRILYWISVGAQPSDTLRNMLISQGVIEGKKVNVLPKKTYTKPVVEEKAPVVAPVVEEAPAAIEETPVVEETPVAETPTE